jgi:hypothetical protein
MYTHTHTHTHLSGAGLIDQTHGAIYAKKKAPEDIKKAKKDESPGRYT